MAALGASRQKAMARGQGLQVVEEAALEGLQVGLSPSEAGLIERPAAAVVGQAWPAATSLKVHIPRSWPFSSF